MRREKQYLMLHFENIWTIYWVQVYTESNDVEGIFTQYGLSKSNDAIWYNFRNTHPILIKRVPK